MLSSFVSAFNVFSVVFKILCYFPNFSAVSWAQNYQKILISFIKPVAELLISPITFILNNFIELDQFPDVRKVARTNPIHKVNQSIELKNYRPASVLSVLLKIYDSVVLEKVIKIIGEKSIYRQYQSGNCKNHSTAKLITKLRDYIKQAAKNKQPATSLKKKLWQRCFPVNFAKFLRTLFLREHLWRLFLNHANTP